MHPSTSRALNTLVQFCTFRHTRAEIQPLSTLKIGYIFLGGPGVIRPRRKANCEPLSKLLGLGYRWRFHYWDTIMQGEVISGQKAWSCWPCKTTTSTTHSQIILCPSWWKTQDLFIANHSHNTLYGRHVVSVNYLGRPRRFSCKYKPVQELRNDTARPVGFVIVYISASAPFSIAATYLVEVLKAGKFINICQMNDIIEREISSWPCNLHLSPEVLRRAWRLGTKFRW
jgi:hypothetical protein